jgi:type II secretory pathway pseudopilin PulG
LSVIEGNIVQGSIALGVIALAATGVYFLYTASQVKAQNAQSVALNNQYFQQTVQQQHLQQIEGTINGTSPVTATGITGTGLLSGDNAAVPS